MMGRAGVFGSDMVAFGLARNLLNSWKNQAESGLGIEQAGGRVRRIVVKSPGRTAGISAFGIMGIIEMGTMNGVKW